MNGSRRRASMPSPTATSPLATPWRSMARRSSNVEGSRGRPRRPLAGDVTTPPGAVPDILGGGPHREPRRSNDQVDTGPTRVQPIDLGPVDLDPSRVP